MNREAPDDGSPGSGPEARGTLLDRLAAAGGRPSIDREASVRRSIAGLLRGIDEAAGRPEAFLGVDDEENGPEVGLAAWGGTATAIRRGGAEFERLVAERVRRLEPRVDPASVRVAVAPGRSPEGVTVTILATLRPGERTIRVRLMPSRGGWWPLDG